MDSTLEHYVEGQDYATLTISIPKGCDDTIHLHADGDVGAWVEIPLYAYQARELIEILTPLANEPDAT